MTHEDMLTAPGVEYSGGLYVTPGPNRIVLGSQKNGVVVLTEEGEQFAVAMAARDVKPAEDTKAKAGK